VRISQRPALYYRNADFTPLTCREMRDISPKINDDIAVPRRLWQGLGIFSSTPSEQGLVALVLVLALSDIFGPMPEMHSTLREAARS
jgi:hypothetical protein